MSNIGNKIKEIRKAKGISQEELAELSNVNLRTIQRIENNNNEPRGKTLNLICEALNINVENISDYGKKTDSNVLVYFHLSVISFLMIPLGNIIVPLILWINQKDKIIGVKEIGANLLNYQILWSVFGFLSVMFFALFKIMYHHTYMPFVVASLLLYASNIILPIIFAIQARQGKTTIRYPNIIHFIR